AVKDEASSFVGTATAPSITVTEVTKAFGSAANPVVALDRISLQARRGEFLCLVGASGCGKTTLLNLICGLDQPTRGEIDINGRASLLFQEAALFPWLTAAGNVELPLRLANVPAAHRKREAQE